jgi:hypothetical protein
MAITRVQEISADGQSTTASATFGTASAPGNFLIALVAFRTGTITGPSGFSSAINNSNSNGSVITIFYLPNAAAMTTITATCSNNTRWVIVITEYSGILTSSPLDATGTGTAASGAAPSGNVTTAYTNELVVAGLADLSGNTYGSPTGGFTLVDQKANINIGCAYLDYFTAVNASTYSTSAGNADGGNGVIASFKSSTSGTSSQFNAIWTGSVF